MNILKHKSWHVRTKENIARVRRDEAKAAAEEKSKQERVTLADHEDRLRRLKMRGGPTSNSEPSPYDVRSTAASTSSSGNNYQSEMAGGLQFDQEEDVMTSDCGGGWNEGGHVNLFAELEQQERKNLSHGNKEYAAQKKKEQDDWESKMGIMKRFAEDTNEYSKKREWWERIPLVRDAAIAEPSSSSSKPPAPISQPSKKEHRHRHKKKRKRSRSPSTSPQPRRKESKPSLEQLRAERLERERVEQERTRQLLAPSKPLKREPKDLPTRVGLELDRMRAYNSQFNPDFVRR